MTAHVFACADCGHVVFPRRLLCPRCGGGRLDEVAVDGGVLEELTTHRGVVVGAVRVQAGPVLVARVDEPLQRGDAVALTTDGEIPVARRS